MQNNLNNEVKSKVIQAISEITGFDEEDITMDSSLEEDIGVDMIQTFPKIMQNLNQNMDNQLPLRNIDFVNELKYADTVGELVEVIKSEVEF